MSLSSERHGALPHAPCVDRCLPDDDRDAAGTIPSFDVEAIVECPGGCLPLREDGRTDLEVVGACGRAAQTDDGLRAWVDASVRRARVDALA